MPTPNQVASSAPRFGRLRWAVLGVALTLAAGGLSVAGAVDSTPSSFSAVTPVRLFDTRNNTGGVGTLPLGPGGQLDFVIGGTHGVPADAKGVALNVAVISGTTMSYLTVWPFGDAKPFTANANWTGPNPLSNAVTVGLGTGGKISVFNQTGTVHVIADLLGYYTALPAAPSTQTASLVSTETPVATINDVGAFSSITIGADNLPIISYKDSTNGDLRVTHCDDAKCSAVTSTTADTGFPATNDVGGYSSIAVGTDGLAIISHYDATTKDLRTTHCTNTACTTATSATVVTTDDVGSYSSIVIGTDGLPIISYSGEFSGAVERVVVVHCADVACTAVSGTSQVDALLELSQTAMSIGSDGLPVISYQGISGAYGLHVAHCDNVGCTDSTTHTVDASPSYGPYGSYSSITVGSDGLAIISQRDNTTANLRVTHCTDVACTAATSTSLATPTNDGYYTSITRGVDGLPIISHHASTPDLDLQFTHCLDVACTTASTTTLARTNSVGNYSAITIGASGLPIISHYDNTVHDLRVFACGTPACGAVLSPGRH
jgi:hypothetical protein